MVARLTIHDDLLPIGVTAEDIAPAITVETDEATFEQRMKYILLLNEIDNCIDGLIMQYQGLPVTVTIDELKRVSALIESLLLPEEKALRDTLQPRLF